MTHDRRSPHLKDFDYSSPGPYFITTVTRGRECLFGSISDDRMQLNEFGQIVADAWQWLGDQFPYLVLGASIVMPDHFHGILMIGDPPESLLATSCSGGSKWYCSGGSRPATTGDGKESRPVPTKIKPLGQLIGAFKTASAKRINLLRGTPGVSIWQRDFYERLIRDEYEMNRIHLYIEANPANWGVDKDDLILWKM